MRRQIWIFLHLVWGERASRVTGSLSAILVLLGLGISVAGAFGAKIPADSAIQLGTWLLAAICGGQAAYSVWSREHAKTLSLEARLTPKINVLYNPNIPACKSISRFRAGEHQFDGMCFRVRVENIGEYPIHHCEGHLTSVYYENEAPSLGEMALIWAGTWPEPVSVDLFSGIPRDLGIIYISESNNVVVCSEGYTWPLNQQEFFARHGKYYFEIRVVGHDTAQPPPYMLELDFTGDWKTSTMSVAQ
jgi:hypothetical protein